MGGGGGGGRALICVFRMCVRGMLFDRRAHGSIVEVQVMMATAPVEEADVLCVVRGYHKYKLCGIRMKVTHSLLNNRHDG